MTNDISLHESANSTWVECIHGVSYDVQVAFLDDSDLTIWEYVVSFPVILDFSLFEVFHEHWLLKPVEETKFLDNIINHQTILVHVNWTLIEQIRFEMSGGICMSVLVHLQIIKHFFGSLDLWIFVFSHWQDHAGNNLLHHIEALFVHHFLEYLFVDVFCFGILI